MKEKADDADVLKECVGEVGAAFADAMMGLRADSGATDALTGTATAAAEACIAGAGSGGRCA